MEYNIDTQVKLITSEMLKSPELKNSFGSLNNLLKLTLTEGFNERIVSSINVDMNNIATIVLPLNHGFFKDTVVIITGATETHFNGQFRLIGVTGTTVSLYIKDTSISQASTTSEITIKVAPLGYTIPYENESEGVICFKNKSLKSPAILKSIDKLPPNGYSESWAKFSRVVIGQSIDDKGDFIDNIKTPFWREFPDAEKTGNGVTGAGGIHGYAKWDYAIHNNYDFMETYSPVVNSFPTDWRIIGDDKTFYLMIRAMGKDRLSFNILGFGNYIPDNKKETFNICLQARHGATVANQNWNYCFLRSGNNFGGLDWDYSGYLFANIYGNTLKQNKTGIFRNVGLMLSSNFYDRPWFSTGINNTTSVGTLITSKLHIKDSDNYVRGHHRGVSLFYGQTSFPDFFKTDRGDLILNVQSPQNTSSSANDIQPLLFSLKNWEQID